MTSLGFPASAELATAGALGVQIMGGIQTVDLPGGAFVMGSAEVDAEHKDARPHWVFLSPFSIGKTPITVGQYRAKMPDENMLELLRWYLKKKISEEEMQSYPVAAVNWNQANEFLSKAGTIAPVPLPTEAQFEYAQRGPAVNLRELMEKETGAFRAGDFVGFVAGRFENFVVQAGGIIFTDPTGEAFQALLRMAIPIYGWRVYPTVSGRLDKEEACYAEETPFPAEFLTPNAFGLNGMAGGVCEWVVDSYHPLAYLFLPNNNPANLWKAEFKVSRGSSWETKEGRSVRAAYRRRLPLNVGVYVNGFRMAGPAQPKGSRYLMPSRREPDRSGPKGKGLH